MSVIITYNLSNTSFVSVVLLTALKNNRIVKLNYSIISNMKIQNITLITNHARSDSYRDMCSKCSCYRNSSRGNIYDLEKYNKKCKTAT